MTGHDVERRALLTPVLLLLLAERQGHGYELVQRLGGFGCADTDPAHVYRLLRGMESSGEVTSRWHASASGPARRVYAITQQGAMDLALWFVRLGELHSTLHLFLERYVQLEDVGGRDGRGGAPGPAARRPAADASGSGTGGRPPGAGGPGAAADGRARGTRGADGPRPADGARPVDGSRPGGPRPVDGSRPTDGQLRETEALIRDHMRRMRR
ncbi:helix-turn-helix transcriptional regulator [Streptomyces sp. Tue6028]|uniref:helix-turn-helix transcriptional regulator n=1 Tax=Streptomyces sp. Tue6028 TaxID=2036037 RepID=UPI003D710863